MWIWQQDNWPNFDWQSATINPLLQRVRLNQGVLLGKMGAAIGGEQSFSLDTLLANIVHSSAIEGEKLNAFSMRSSLAKKLGLVHEQQHQTTLQSEGLAAILWDAVSNWQQPLSLARVLQWHEQLFPPGYTLFNPIEGGTLRADEPMMVVSGRIDKPVVHFEAPPRSELEQQVKQFIDWFNLSEQDACLDPFIRAGIAHLWFVTLHPLEDGNGRITRLLTDLALAQCESQSIRFYAMSVSIAENRKAYYQMLEQTQRGGMDITAWLEWFLTMLDDAINQSLRAIELTVVKGQFWQRVNQALLSREQVKVLNRLLDGDFREGISASQYRKVAKVSRATATRHLVQLVESGCLQKSGSGGRSTRYLVVGAV